MGGKKNSTRKKKIPSGKKIPSSKKNSMRNKKFPELNWGRSFSMGENSRAFFQRNFFFPSSLFISPHQPHIPKIQSSSRISEGWSQKLGLNNPVRFPKFLRIPKEKGILGRSSRNIFGPIPGWKKKKKTSLGINLG